MKRLLLSCAGPEGQIYMRWAASAGIEIQVLDCFEDSHRRLRRWYGDKLLNVPGRKAQVAQTVANHHFDGAIIQESGQDVVRSALITQSLRESGLRDIIVVTADAKRAAIYRRCGAHQVVIAPNPDLALNRIAASFSPFASA